MRNRRSLVVGLLVAFVGSEALAQVHGPGHEGRARIGRPGGGPSANRSSGGMLRGAAALSARAQQGKRLLGRPAAARPLARVPAGASLTGRLRLQTRTLASLRAGIAGRTSARLGRAAAQIRLRAMQRQGLPLDAVVFDLDGTLADTSEDIVFAVDHALKDMGVHATPEQLRAYADGRPLARVFDEALPNGTEADRQRFFDAFDHHYDHNPEPKVQLYPGVRETLATLNDQRPDLPLAVATARNPDQAKAILRSLGIASRFKVIAGSGGTAIRPKPAPDLIEHVASRLQVDPRRMIMVGDTPGDVLAGKGAGAYTAVLRYGYGAPEAIRAAGPNYSWGKFDRVLSVVGIKAPRGASKAEGRTAVGS